MLPVVGVFKSQSAADQAAQQLRSTGMSRDQINMLTPHYGQAADGIPRVAGEQPGMVQAIGAVAGAAAGLGIGEGLATLLVPGVGPVLAIGLVGGALLGALAGGAIGNAGENAIFSGLPGDELFIYEDALRQNRTVLVTMATDRKQADAARTVLDSAGAESIDKAREMWWLGMRDVEKEHYEVHGRNFERDEADFKRGFEAALQLENADKSYDACSALLAKRYPDTWNSDAFRQGFERGCIYCSVTRQKVHAN